MTYRLSHWIGFLAWSVAFFLGARFVARRLPDRDPFLVPLAGLLSGWGLLTVWRLDASLGLRQAAWLGVGMAAAAFAILRQRDLDLLRRYKYVLLGAGLASDCAHPAARNKSNGHRAAAVAGLLRTLLSAF